MASKVSHLSVVWKRICVDLDYQQRVNREQYDVSIVIPTLGEREDLLSCIESIADQTTTPNEVIVVNDGNTNTIISRRIQNKLACPVIITTSDGSPGTSTARNTGVKESTGRIVLILDDDVIIGPSYLERLCESYARFDNNNLAGIGGFDSALREPSLFERIYNRTFYLGNVSWDINAVGMQSWDPTIRQITRGEWLSGNNASFKREVLLDHPFSHWCGGREPLEDIAMGMELQKEGYYCLIDPELPIKHFQSEDAETTMDFGIKRGRNRVRIFRKYGSIRYLPLFLWALLGDTLRQFLAPILDSEYVSHWLTGIGMIVGILAELSTLESK